MSEEIGKQLALVKIKNLKGFNALNRARELAADAKESYPWCSELSELVSELEIAANELLIVPLGPGE